MGFDVLMYIMVFALGVCVGSFANVCILRIPEKQSIIPPSQCVRCGRKLKWYELIPIFSFLALRGKCLGCKAPISPQYPLIEGANGILWVLVFMVFGVPQVSTAFEASMVGEEFLLNSVDLTLATPVMTLITTFVLCFAASALLILAVIDIRTMEIPPALNYTILALGLIRLALDYTNWYVYLIGAVSVSGVLLILWFITGGHALGGGDIKLMAVCGLLIGWKSIILAFLLGCIIGSVVHLVRMALSPKAGRVLAFGPYLAAGVFVSMLWGERLLNWYLSFFASA